MAFFGFGGRAPAPRYNTVAGRQAGSGAFMSNGGVFSSGVMPAGAMNRGAMNGRVVNGGTSNQGWNGEIASTTYVDVPEIRTVEKLVEVPEIEIQEVVKNVPKYEYVENVVTVPRREVHYVERVVEVPEVHTIEYPRQGFVDRPSFSCNWGVVLGVVLCLMLLAVFAAFVPLAIIPFQGQSNVQSDESMVTTAVSGSSFDCEAGFGNWEQGWTEAKKLVCCKVKGCGTQATTVSEAFDCDFGFSNWQQGWSFNKQLYCCAHRQKGCIE